MQNREPFSEMVLQLTEYQILNLRWLVPYAPPAYKAKLGKALIHNRIRVFFVSGLKQNIGDQRIFRIRDQQIFLVDFISWPL